MDPHSHDQKDFHDFKEITPLQTEHVLDRIVWRKLDKWILPLCTALFLLSFLDRSNIANARLVGLQSSLDMSNYQYTVALTLTYVSYAASEFPSTLLLKYVGPNIMLPAMATSWGIVSAAQGLVSNYSGLLACRFFLGFLEGGIYPGIVLYLSSFYPRKVLQIRLSTFYALSALGNAFSGLLAAAIDNLNGRGGKPSWAWIFILEGLLSFILGIICFFLLPRSPEKARFFTEEESEYVISALKQAGVLSEDESQDKFSWSEVAKSAKSVHIWILLPGFFFSGAIVFGLAFFEPTIVAGLGYSGNQAQLMSVPPYAVASFAALIAAFISDRYQCRGYTALFGSLLQIIGFSMFYASTSSNVRYGSLFFSVPGAICAAPALTTWLSNNSAPHVRRAAAVGIAFVTTELGGILATWLLGWLSPAPNYKAATITFIAMSVGMMVSSTANWVYLWRENRIKAAKRQKMRKEDELVGLGDRSAWFIYSL